MRLTETDKQSLIKLHSDELGKELNDLQEIVRRSREITDRIDGLISKLCALDTSFPAKDLIDQMNKAFSGKNNLH